MKDSRRARNDLPTGIVERIFSSDDGLRKVYICIVNDNTRSIYVRLILEIVTLIEVN